MKKYNGVIEIYRWGLILGMCLMHLEGSLYSDSSIFEGFYLCVDFFFILSGFLQMQGMNEKYNSNNFSTVTITLHRLKTFTPYIIISIFIRIVLEFIHMDHEGKFVGMIDLVLKETWELSYLMMDGKVNSQILNIPIWFISALVICGYLIGICFEIYKDKFKMLGLPLLCLISYAVLSTNIGHLDVHIYWINNSFITGGILRAMGGLSLGSILYFVYCTLKDKMSNLGVLLDAIWLFCGLAIAFCVVARPRSEFDYIAIYFWSVLLVISWHKQTYITSILDYLGNLVTQIFGKELILSIYINSNIVQILFCDYIRMEGRRRLVRDFVYLVVLVLFSKAICVFVKFIGKNLKSSQAILVRD